MAQLSAAIDGIAEACTALGTPITGGNVSLYNETRGEGIYPTPVLGIVGILDDVTKAVPADFQHAGDAILLLWPIPARRAARPRSRVPFHPAPIKPISTVDPGIMGDPSPLSIAEDAAKDSLDEPAAELAAFGSSEYAKVVLNSSGARRRRSTSTPNPTCTRCSRPSPTASSFTPPATSPTAASPSPSRRPRSQRHRRHHRAGTVAHDSSALRPLRRTRIHGARQRADPSNVAAIEELADELSFFCARIGTTGGERLEISVDGEPFISASIDELRTPWATALEATLHGEVLA